MKELTIFNFEQNEVRTLQVNGEPWFVLTDVCKVLELTTPKKVADRLDADEKGMSSIHTPGGKQNLKIINESGLYAVILRSDKPQAKQFRKWITAEVLPTLRKTGSYAIKNDEKARQLAIKEQNAATRKENANIRKAQLLYKVGESCGIESYKQVIDSHVTYLLTGQALLPLPEAKEQTYSAGEIGALLGISANKVGKIANEHNLKTDEFGVYVWDKSQYSAHQCRTFRYNKTGLFKLMELVLKKGEVA